MFRKRRKKIGWRNKIWRKKNVLLHETIFKQSFVCWPKLNINLLFLRVWIGESRNPEISWISFASDATWISLHGATSRCDSTCRTHSTDDVTCWSSSSIWGLVILLLSITTLVHGRWQIAEYYYMLMVLHSIDGTMYRKDTRFCTDQSSWVWK